jgi:asparagine synthase (glutamine-hydrolysing)
VPLFDALLAQFKAKYWDASNILRLAAIHNGHPCARGRKRRAAQGRGRDCGMCGIAVVIGGRAGVPDGVLTRMTSVAARRGPEGIRTWCTRDVQLAHCALSFVARGNNVQPRVRDDGTWLVWNGEIYNWKKLSESHRLGAQNDTDTLLLGLLAQGAQFLRELDGQFAFVAQLADSIIVGRDKWGICPLTFGRANEGFLAIGSTTEVVQAAGIRDIKAVPAGTVGVVRGSELALSTWYRLQARAPAALDADDVRRFAEQRVHSRIPDRADELFTTMGGIDSQFVTAAVARHTHGNFGGAVTVVPHGMALGDLGDYPYVRATLDLLEREGIRVAHHVAVLTPEFAAQNLDRLLRLLGPDMFQLICAFGEDLVAQTVQQAGGRTIMTAGGPDEAGRSYDRWTFVHRGLDQELAWRRLAEQFSSSEGVRAGLVFGERGIENRVPLADLIELATQLPANEKQQIQHAGDGRHVSSLRMESKIFWRRALRELLPHACIAAPKQPIHGSIRALDVLHGLACADAAYRQERSGFVHQAFWLGWNGIVYAVDMRCVEPSERIAECQLYALYRWSKLEPELFEQGGAHRYGAYVNHVPRSQDEPRLRVHKPLCYDWQIGPEVPLRPVL